MGSIFSDLFNAFKKTIQRVRNADYSNPRNMLLFLGLLAFPFIAWYYFSTGIVVGIMMSIAILWLVEKSPWPIRYLIAKFPLTSDVILSTTVVVMFGKYFGNGLILGISALCAALILSWALQINSKRFFEEKQNEKTAYA